MGVIVMKDWIVEKYYQTNRNDLADKHFDIEILEAELRQEDIEEIYKEYYS
ncbi:hypothetical protein GNF53_11630 [Clostridium perfringens]|uniref:hypothetical protein n=1 Tax=Clostridium perfringens TaxID=1502 RepID=UPI001A2B17BA|nr:hypothetical protein [Clostridium perfringens]MDK0658206.1 hypothetical protein [Clostridium perfringens]MDK0943474.1 hypothetical protein [Clostridium perfringens]MDK0960992.1 hypothetical protein [Clostridium perfringens]MDK0963968.1 hypothetical protein [Clostridium perfringens]MDK0969782.1 hypothetical protein [Clostridium perfringens]